MKEGDSETSKEKERLRSEQKSKAKMSQSTDISVPDCAVCLQSCVHPVELPCSHVFCFLCVKGASTQYRRCALCRQEIPIDFFTSPKLLLAREVDDDDDGEDVDEHYTWFYEGRNGWWQYDERTNIELEESYRANKRTFELLIAGYVYVIDLDSMLQYRRSDPSRRRRIKRDLVTAPKKGIAGLKIKVKREEESTDREVVGAEEEKENAGAVGGASVTQSKRNKSKVGKKKTNDDKESSQVEENEGDDNGHNTRTPSSSASLGDSASGESVYEVHLTGAPSRSTEESVPSNRNTSRSVDANEPPSYTMPARKQRKPTGDSSGANSQMTRDGVSVDQNSSLNAVAGGLHIHHQRTHSAPEVRPLPRPRASPPQAPPRSRSSNQNITQEPGRAEEISSSSNQSFGPSSVRPEDSTDADTVQGLSERMRSELVISIERSSGARRRQTHHHVHEV